jgi:hypothetical protein
MVSLHHLSSSPWLLPYFFSAFSRRRGGTKLRSEYEKSQEAGRKPTERLVKSQYQGIVCIGGVGVAIGYIFYDCEGE